MGRELTGRLRSADCDLLGSTEPGNGVIDAGVELAERRTRGDGHLLEDDDVEEEDEVLVVVVEVEGEGDMYLEETCLDLGFLRLLTPLLLSFSEGNNGGLLLIGFS